MPSTAVWVTGILTSGAVVMGSVVWMNPGWAVRQCYGTLGRIESSVGFKVSETPEGQPFLEFGAAATAGGTSSTAQLTSFGECVRSVLGEPVKQQKGTSGGFSTIGYMAQLYARNKDLSIVFGGNNREKLQNFEFPPYSGDNPSEVIANWCVTRTKCIVCDPLPIKDPNYVTISIRENSEASIIEEAMPGDWPKPDVNDQGKYVSNQEYIKFDEDGQRVWYSCKS